MSSRNYHLVDESPPATGLPESQKFKMSAKVLFYRIGLVCSVTAFVLMFVAFTSPFWYKSWTRVHSSFGNIGLWHVCLYGFIIPTDPAMKSYVGCWWIHSEEFVRVASEIMPRKKCSVFKYTNEVSICLITLLNHPPFYMNITGVCLNRDTCLLTLHFRYFTLSFVASRLCSTNS